MRSVDRDLGSSSLAVDRDFFLGCGLCFSGFVLSFFFSKHQKIFSGKFFEMQPNTWKYFPFPEISISGKYVFFGKRFIATKHSLILDYKPILRTFLDVGNSIRANDYRLAHIDVSRPDFLAPHDLPPVDHPVLQGIPLAAQPLRQVPLAQAVAEEEATSSSSLEEEIDKFQFEEETIVISEAEEEVDEYLCVQTPAPIITYVGDSSDNEDEEMAPKTGPSLRELMKGRNKVPSSQEKAKSKPPVNPPPPPQLPADLGLKPNPDLKRKRYIEAFKEGEVGPSKGSKQQRQSQDPRSRRSSSVDS